MRINLKETLEEGVSLPTPIAAGRFSFCGYNYDSGGRLLLESKIDMRRRGLPSPDEGDAVALCFAQADGYSRVKGFGRELVYPRAIDARLTKTQKEN